MQKQTKNSGRITRQMGILSMAAAATLLARSAGAATDIWTSTAAGTTYPSATPNNIWLNANNWSPAAVPGTGDVAQFTNASGGVSALPKNNTVTLDFGDGTITTGAITDVIPATISNPALTFTAPTAGTLTLNGATVTTAVPSGTQTAGSTSETFNNVILANTDNAIVNKNFNLSTGINIALPNATNNILNYGGTGNTGSANSALPTMNVSGNISNAGATAAGIVFLGGGTPTVEGGNLVLAGTNTFSGGLTIGNVGNGSASQVNLQSGEVTLASPAALPGTGTITVNEQSQLYFSASTSAVTNYSNGSQTLVLNGIGLGKNVSGALRPKGGSQNTPIQWLGNIQLGTSASYDQDNGAVLTTVGTAGSWFRLVGNMTGGNWIEQGGGVFALAGTNNTYGSTQLGNGGVYVEPQSSLGNGDLILFQTSTNNPTLTLNNASQTVQSLISSFTATNLSSGVVNNANGFVQNITLNGTTLKVTEPANSTFGYGSYYTLTSGLNDGSTGIGALALNSTTGHTLTLTGQNSYSGGTTVNSGTLDLANNIAGITVTSALGSGPVQVNSGGILASGNATIPAGFTPGSSIQTITGGTFTGQLNVSSGGIVSPGGGNIGYLNTGPISASPGSIFDFAIASATAGNFSQLNSSGGITFSNSGTETLNVTGSTLAVGTFNLINGSSITSNASGGGIVLGTTPNGRNRTYALNETATQIQLIISNTGVERDWSLGGLTPAADGAGTWQSGSTNFYQTSGTTTTTQVPYNNSASADTEFGAGGNGGIITLGSNVIVGGNFILGPLAAGQSYTFAPAAATSNSLTLVGGVSASNNTSISSLVVLGGSQAWSTDGGVTLSVSGNISESVAGSQLTKTGNGTVVLSGTGSWTGGTNVSQGTLQTATTAVPVTGGIVNNSVLDFDQTTSGSYAGLISGSGSVTVSNVAGTGTPSVALTNAGNTYTGSTTVAGGTLAVGAVGDLGTGDGGIILSGGTLQATANLLFPLNPGGGSTQKRTLTLSGGTTSTIDTQSYTVEFDSNIKGSGNLVKLGTGTLVLEGIPSTTNIGGLIASQGTIQIAQQLAGASFVFQGSASPTSGAQETGTIEVTGPTLTRLQGGYFSGGGKFQIDPTGVQLIGYGLSNTVVGNSISLNPANISGGFISLIGADTSCTLALNGPITGNADVDFTGGAGLITLGASSTYTGATTIDNSTGGKVQLAVNNALPLTTNVTVTNPGVLDLNGYNQSIASLTSTHTGSVSTATVENSSLTSNSILTITGSASTTFSGSLTDNSGAGTLGLTMNAPGGALALSGEGEYAGPTTILNGRLDITTITQDILSNGNVTGLGATGSISIGNHAGDTTAQLRFNGLNGSGGSPVVIQFNPANYALSTAYPTITLKALGGFQNSSGTLDQGAIRVTGQSNIALDNPIVFASSSVIAVADGSTLLLDNSLSGSGSLIAQGNGTLNLQGVNTTFTGGTEVDAGTVNVLNGSALGTGPLAVNNDTSNGSNGSPVVLNLNNAAQSVGSLSGTFNPSFNGSNSATINLGSHTVLTVNQTVNNIFGGAINGSGGQFTKTGPATLTLAGGVNYTGTTTVSAGQLIFGPGSGPGFQTINSAGGVIVANGALLNVSSGLTTPTRTLLITQALTLTGTGSIDLNNNDMVYQGGLATDLTTVSGYVKTGYANGTWAGNGIRSTAAGNSANHLMALGVIQNTAPGGGLLKTTFDGTSVFASDILVKYTYYGDADLNGIVDGTDYSRIDSTYLQEVTTHTNISGWGNGDFNYDGVVDGSDYTLLDNAYNSQAGQISAEIATPTAEIASGETSTIGGTSAVPEPAVTVLLAIAALGQLSRRRRNKVR